MRKITLIKIISGVVVVASLVATTTLFISHKLKHKKVFNTIGGINYE